MAATMATTATAATAMAATAMAATALATTALATTATTRAANTAWWLAPTATASSRASTASTPSRATRGWSDGAGEFLWLSSSPSCFLLLLLLPGVIFGPWHGR